MSHGAATPSRISAVELQILLGLLLPQLLPYTDGGFIPCDRESIKVKMPSLSFDRFHVTRKSLYLSSFRRRKERYARLRSDMRLVLFRIDVHEASVRSGHVYQMRVQPLLRFSTWMSAARNAGTDSCLDRASAALMFLAGK